MLTFQNEVLEHYTELYAEAFKDRILDLQNVHQPVLLSPYDADNETFELDFGLFERLCCQWQLDRLDSLRAV